MAGSVAWPDSTADAANQKQPITDAGLRSGYYYRSWFISLDVCIIFYLVLRIRGELLPKLRGTKEKSTPPATASSASSESSPAGTGGSTKWNSLSVFSTTVTVMPAGTSMPSAFNAATGLAINSALKDGSRHALATILPNSGSFSNQKQNSICTRKTKNDSSGRRRGR